MKTQNDEQAVTINLDRITLSFLGMEPIEIPRRTLRTRLQLLQWVYRLTDWPGMDLRRMRKFIAAVSRHHGWALPDEMDIVVVAQQEISPTDNLKLSTASITSHGRSLAAA